MQASLVTRFGSAAAVAVLAAGGVMATATAASAAGHPAPKPKLDATTLSIKNKPIAHSRHHATSITGVLRDEHTRVANETITLKSEAVGKHVWTVVGTQTTGTDGSVTFSGVAVTAKTHFKLVFAGDTTYRGSHSNVILVKP